jgi:hypothetical protein
LCRTEPTCGSTTASLQRKKFIGKLELASKIQKKLTKYNTSNVTQGICHFFHDFKFGTESAVTATQCKGRQITTCQKSRSNVTSGRGGAFQKKGVQFFADLVASPALPCRQGITSVNGWSNNGANLDFWRENESEQSPLH